ncbi:MAG: amidase [Rhodospirillales bacterium]|jgi:aspartyl-tRNA(Asn)/glutamyl-tRNA(Gln) amidotransferase subunit A|nr:amidase [Rhodospirillales bacterium]
MTDLANLSLIETAAAIAAGEVTSEAATIATVARLKERGSLLNCVIRMEEHDALESARAADKARTKGKIKGPLHGVPLAHKDLLFREGKVVSCGAKITRDFVPDHTASVLTRLENAGAVYVAALHLAEFARSPTGHNEHFGPCRNPWNPEHVTGGSSSGSGASVAARLVPAALGSDTGGSIRLPAAMCGVVGLMPTQGLVSRAGVMPISWSMDTVGPLARTAADCARMLSVIAGQDPADPTTRAEPVPDYESALAKGLEGAKIAVPRNWFYDDVSDAVAKALDESLRVLREAGAEIVETTVPDMALIDDVQHVLREVEAATVHSRWLKTRPEDYSEQVRTRTEPGFFYTGTRYCEALLLRGPILEDFLKQAFAGADMVHLPAVSMPVPTIVESTGGGIDNIQKYIRLIGRCTRHINYLGLPAISVPCGFADAGLPVAFQLVGRPFAEARLLAAAHAYQSLTDWHEKAPPAD